MKNRVCFIVIMIWGLCFKAYALKEATHVEINKTVAQRNIDGFSLDSYIQDYLGFQGGVKQQILGLDADLNVASMLIYEWLGYGGEQEDRPGSNWDFAVNNPTRSVNHFHDPLKSWDKAGLNDTFVNTYRGESSVLWAQDRNQWAWGRNYNIGGHWSWGDAREYFYSALTGTDFSRNTVARTEWEKDRYLADTFRAIGQLMHLVHDSSVPEHVRNSIHIKAAYESQVEAFRSKRKNGQLKYGNLWDNLLEKPIIFDRSILDIATNNTLAPVPIARIVDTDKYDGSNPDVTKTADNSPQTVGLAEYTNANFLNKDTMFESYTYPRAADTEIWVDANKKKYIRKNSGNGDVVNHLAVTGILYSYRKRHFPQYEKHLPVTMDEECYKDYAQHLIPRAVGYSAGLLKYFFRGTLKVDPPAEHVYAITDGSQTYPFDSTYFDSSNPPQQVSVTTQQQQFTRIKAKVTNTTPDEEMKAGTLTVVAEYKVIPVYQPDLSTYPPTAAMMDEVPLSYSVSSPTDIAAPLAANAARDFEFNFPDQPIPAGVTDLSMYVVFKGTLGNEKDNAIAVAWQPLFEPVHQAFWNLTDRFSLNDVLKTDTEIDNDPTWRAQVDWNANGITSEWPSEPYIKPYPMSFEIGYAAKNPPDQPVTTIAKVDDVQPGGYIRLITLVSEPTNYVKLKSTNDTVGTTEFVDTFYGTVCNGYESAFACEAKKTFRNVRQDYNVGLLRCNPLATDASGNKYCSYNESGVALTNFGPLSVGIKFGTQGQ